LRIGPPQRELNRDLVVARFSAAATPIGEMMGAAPTGKRVTFEGIDMLRIQGDRVTELRRQGNQRLMDFA